MEILIIFIMNKLCFRGDVTKHKGLQPYISCWSKGHSNQIPHLIMGINLKLFILKLSDNDQQMVHLTDLQKMDKAYQSLESPQVNKQISCPICINHQNGGRENSFLFTTGTLDKQASLDEGNLEKQIKCKLQTFGIDHRTFYFKRTS